MTRFLIILLFLLSSPLLISCASPARPTGYLQDYSELKPGQNLDLYWSDRELIKQGQYSGIEIGRIESRVVGSEKVSEEDACNWLRSAIISNQASSEDLVLGSQSENTANLNLAITEMSPGSAFARIMAGEFGAGHAWVQIEGSVTDQKEGHMLVCFSDRRRASGAIGFRDVGGDSGSAMLQEMINSIGLVIRSELRTEFGF